ncbi:hypothetical protein yc1106_01638 [Curvularia clavata]|uniref:Uncharacterized protein n=1 Tax=Curvularia clavata TaxID=95742 RepID=A0A9Q9DQ72_CURCL|nr:hypothetical protein yc1106_01638 [Curvularia clavata]
MQLQTLFLAGLALATGATADRLLTTTAFPLIGACNSRGEWQASNGNVFYNVDANEGCRNPGVPYVYNLCMDWGKGRAHWNVDNQPNKKCFLEQGSDFDVGPCAGSGLSCSRQ